MRQFVKCQFNGNGRAYTYHNDGEPVAVGDMVDVETNHGIARVEVIGLVDDPPTFETRPILGPSEREVA